LNPISNPNPDPNPNPNLQEIATPSWKKRSSEWYKQQPGSPPPPCQSRRAITWIP
jgi:hypothetical protein